MVRAKLLMPFTLGRAKSRLKCHFDGQFFGLDFIKKGKGALQNNLGTLDELS